jgi:nitrite reductase/ring-hydroxylating ferredoxin subunit
VLYVRLAWIGAIIARCNCERHLGSLEEEAVSGAARSVRCLSRKPEVSVENDGFVRVLSLADLPRGRMHCLEVGARQIVICNTVNGVYAVDDICTHALARMSEGRLRGVRLICPLHGAAFDVRDGKVLGGPATRALPTHEVRIVEGAVEVRIDPAAPPQEV